MDVRPKCGGIYNVTNKSPKTITFRNIPDDYHESVDVKCNFTFVTDTEHTIVTRFIPIWVNYYRSDDCESRGYVKVYKWNKWSKEMDLNGKHCISSLDKQFSAQNSLLLEFSTRGGGYVNSFKFEYYLESCRDVVRSPGWIYSPKGKTDILDECEWTIEAPENHQIKISFENFHVGKTFTCRYSSFGVHVYKGNDTESSYKICGRFNETKTIKIPANRGSIKYYSPYNDEDEGFKVKVEFIRMCDENIVLTDGPKMLEKRLDNRTDNYECNYYLSAPEGYRIEVEFQDLKMLGGEGDCKDTFVELYEGYEVHEGLITKLCKNEPIKFVSPENKLNILAKGRTLDFKIAMNISKTWCGSGEKEIILNDEKAETIQFAKYPPNLYCKWIIKSDSYFDIIVDYLDLQKRSDVTGECLDELSINSFTVSFFIIFLY